MVDLHSPPPWSNYYVDNVDLHIFKYYFLFTVVEVTQEATEEVEISETFKTELEIVEETAQVEFELELKPTEGPSGKQIAWLVSNN